MKKRIIVTGGGTGGHLYPGLAILDELAKNFETYYVGSKNKIEGRIVPKTGHKFISISSRPFPNGFSGALIFFPSIILGVLKSLLILLTIRPKAIVGVGGFVSFPLCATAIILRRNVFVHEANVSPGMANRILVRMGAKFLATFPETCSSLPKAHCSVVGCPVREVMLNANREESRKHLGIPHDQKVCLFIGGSGGAEFITRSAIVFADKMQGFSNLTLVHISGHRYHDIAMEALSIRPEFLEGRILLMPFSEEVDKWYSASDLAVSRCGSSTINEFLSVRLPAILIPSPNVAENHQDANARQLEEYGVAIRVTEENEPNVAATAAFDLVRSDERIQQMNLALAHLPSNVAVARIKQVIENSINN